MVSEKQGKYLLHVGGVFTEATMLARAGVSTAGNRWQLGLVRGLREAGERVRVLGHVPEPIWPRGRALIHRRLGAIPVDVSGDLVGYWNVPALRPRSLVAAYEKAYWMTCRRYGSPWAILSYNVTLHAARLARQAKAHGIPWVCVVADVPDAGHARDEHDRLLAGAAGTVFLSWKLFREAGPWPSLHLDGGAGALHFNEQEPPVTGGRKALLYTGAMNQYGGVASLLAAFRAVTDPRVELWLCGKGDSPEARRQARLDPRIRWYGLVSEDQLADLSSRAFAFVNPRPTGLAASAGNFPSKVLEYLSYGKPVLSTWTAGLSEEYRDVLTVFEDDSHRSMVTAIEDVLTWSPERLLVVAGRIHAFLVKRLWPVQARRLARWLREEVLRS
jgi:glycosyltransferase involved in cell wall biosynthesis